MAKYSRGDLVQVKYGIEDSRMGGFQCTVKDIDEMPVKPIYMVEFHDTAVWGSTQTGVYFWIGEDNIEEVNAEESEESFDESDEGTIVYSDGDR